MPNVLLKGFCVALLLAGGGGYSAYAQQTTATQQEGACTGLVVDDANEPVIGATVRIANTSIVGATDIDGRFNLRGVKKGARIHVSAVGYGEASAVWNGEPVTIQLKEQDNALDEVVVVGYGVQKKANLTGSVASINADALASRSVQSISTAMTGQMPGVTVVQSSGAPGAQTGSITIRGQNTINAASPLVIVDGVPGSMNNIDPQDVESISVLKDAASSAIYGVQAANGVILITTKKGKIDQKATVNYSGSVSWARPTEKLDFVNAAEYAEMYNAACYYSGIDAKYSDDDIQKYRDHSDPYGHPDTDWYNSVFKKTAVETQHSLAINGGSKNTTYMASVAYLYQGGFTDEKNYERFNGRINLDSQIAKWISLGLNVSAYRATSKDEYVGINTLFQYVNRHNATLPIYVVEKNADGKAIGFTDEYSNQLSLNPMAVTNGQSGFQKQIDDQLHFNGYLNITPIEGLSIKGLFSWRHDHRDFQSFKKLIEFDGYSSANREGYHNYYNWDWYTYQLLANYMKSFGKNNFNILLGGEAQKYEYRYTTAYAKGGGTDDLFVLNTLDTGNQVIKDSGWNLTRQSYFGRLQYDFDSKYLFEFNMRADASSRFPKDNRWGYFPAVSAGWRIFEESFMEGTRSWLSNLKLRLGWGKTGNEEVSDDNYYPAIPTYSFYSVATDGSLYTASYESRMVNNNLKWATVTNWELGLDAGFLNNKVGFELNLYRKKTNDMLLSLPILQVIGMSAPDQNAGKVENKGIELNVYHNNRVGGDFSYAVNFNISYNKNKILDLAGTDSPYGNYIYKEGEAIGSYYGYKVIGMFKDENDIANSAVRTGTEKPGNLKYEDVNGDGKITADDRVIMGRDFPAWNAGLNFQCFWRDFDFSMLWQGAWDVDRFFTGEAIYAFYNSGTALRWQMDYWTETNLNAKYPRLSTNASGSVDATVNSFWMRDASYLRLKSVVLGYTIPTRITTKAGIERVRVYIAGENPLTFSHLHDLGIDPEAPSGTRGAFYSNVKKLSLGLKVTF